jgi:hypothetical protein
MMKQPFALGANPYMKPMFHDRLRWSDWFM